MIKSAKLALLVAVAGSLQAVTVLEPPPDSLVSPSIFRNVTNHHKDPCTQADSYCLAHHLMYLQCGAILVEKMALNEGESPIWYAYSMHSGPKVPFSHAGYNILISFDPSLPATWYTGQEFDPIANTAGDSSAAWPNGHLVEFVGQTVDWMNSNEWTITDACELREFWKDLRLDSFDAPQQSDPTGEVL